MSSRSSHSKEEITVDLSSQVPFYKQLMGSIQHLIEKGRYKDGDILPSMNGLSESLSVSKETVKKAYAILREKGVIESAQGKGFYVTENKGALNVLMIFDKLSTYKLVLARSFKENAGENIQTTIRIHDQDIDLFETLVHENLDNFDYYLITPHFPIDDDIQRRAITALGKIPNRKLIILDRKVESFPGNYGMVYQDYEQDVHRGLSQGKGLFEKYTTVNTISTGGSLYGAFTEKGIERFCLEHGIDHRNYKTINPEKVLKGGVYIVLNSQLDIELIEIIRIAKSKNLKIGDDIGIVSYNESPINEIILDGLTVLSTDFQEMGAHAAEMVKSGKLSKIWNKFDLIIRKTL